MKVKVKTLLTYDNKEIEHETFGILNKNKLSFVEENNHVFVYLLDKIIIREDKDKRLEYKLEENVETLNDVFIKSSNLSISVPIFTKKFKFNNNSCDIEYKLVLEDSVVNYSLSWEEV